MEDEEIELTVKISMSVNMEFDKKKIKQLIAKHLRSLQKRMEEDKDVGIVNHIKITNLKGEAEIYKSDE